jgi:TetR/AcrR family fatty acid metabolism transcriptional regulator
MHELFNIPEKKFNIYMAAATVFGRKGFYKTTIEEIAQEASIGKSTVYEYVESKEKLFSDIVSHGFGFFMERLAEILKDGESTEEKIKSFIKAWLKLIKNHYSLYRVILCDYYDPCRDKKNQELFGVLKTRMEELLADTVNEGIKEGKLRQVDVSLLSISLVGILMGVSSSFDRNDRDSIDIEKLSEEIGDIFLKGIMLKP